ncbi:MAG: hypothetical protein COB20_13910, partial [SAR86 cluster bacterium]
MLRLSRLVFIMLGFILIAPAAYAQDAEDSRELEGEKAQEREARREERRRQIDSLSDEQRQALRERRGNREARRAGQGSKRPQRR